MLFLFQINLFEKLVKLHRIFQAKFSHFSKNAPFQQGEVLARNQGISLHVTALDLFSACYFLPKSRLQINHLGL